MPKDRPPRFFASPTERHDAVAISRIAACNPFLPERIELEREALEVEFDESGADWNLSERCAFLRDRNRVFHQRFIVHHKSVSFESGEDCKAAAAIQRRVKGVRLC